MNKSHILSLILAIALLLTTYQLMQKDQAKKQEKIIETSQKDAVLNVIQNRKSVRRYTDQAVSKEEINTLLKAGMAAPTAGNKQPWAFVAVSDKQILAKLGDALPYAKMTKTASAAIVVCGDLTKTFDGEVESLYWVQDASAASENILLAVEAMELGAVWTGVYPMMERVELVQDILDIDEHLVPLNVIAIGHPDGDTPAKDKWKEENIIWKN